MAGFDHRRIEQKARETWAALNLYETNLADDTKEPYYLLVEFPYPSGDLHIGHWYAFAVTDIYARFLRMRGKNVFFPIGFDAFGLPAENAAIKNGADPAAWTYANIERMKGQIASMGASFDWSKQVVACDPDYYKWTQWLFTKLFEHDLAERREAPVKWCPKDRTVLANEQVKDGRCDRCGTEVEEKILTQWFLKITQYAERLLKDLDALPWREEIKDAQRAWIGKSDGAHLNFEVRTSDVLNPHGTSDVQSIKVFTTRPDTLFGATYLVLAPEHPLVSGGLTSVTNRTEIEAYVNATSKKTERERSENKEKTGVRLEGVSAINPATKEEIPIFIADYVLASYGTGAIMAVPAHDERDFAFAQKFTLPIRAVVANESGQELYAGDGALANSGDFTGRNNREAAAEIVAFAGGEMTTQYRLRDWLVSRQRYWGCPIPIVYDPEGTPHLIPAEHLPWLLPTDVDFAPAGKSPLASSNELRERVVKIFGEGWTPEYDTLDTFVDSSWYFTRYLDAKDENKFSDEALMKKWLPVKRYSGGAEHTTMHLLYSRFFTKALYDLALVPVAEPYAERFNRGIILGPDGAKMSKSKGNVINPDDMVGTYGADAVRVYLAFIGPYNEPGSYPWNLDGVASMRKFLDRVVRLAEKSEEHGVTATSAPRTPSPDIQSALAKTAKKVGEDCDKFKFNTAIAALMTLLNQLEREPAISRETLRALIIMLAPFAPHLAEHLFERSGGEGSIHQASWPQYDPSLLAESESEIIVQVSGKRRGSVRLASASSQEEALAAARALPAVAAALGGEEPSRVVYVPGRILNLVV